MSECLLIVECGRKNRICVVYGSICRLIAGVDIDRIRFDSLISFLALMLLVASILFPNLVQ